MSRAKTNKLYRTFIKGLITEAGFLTYPENASTDELNTVLKKKGNRSRRLGLDYEVGSVAATIPNFNRNSTLSSFYWRAADNDPKTDFVVVQVDTTLHFFVGTATSVTGTKKSFTVDLTAYKVNDFTGADVASRRCQFAAGKGHLFVANETIDPLLIDYEADTDTITVNRILVLMRDFDGLNDGLLNDEEPSTLSKEHFYNLRNQGWVLPGSSGVYTGGTPPATHTPPAQPTTTDPGGYNPREPYDYNQYENIP